MSKLLELGQKKLFIIDNNQIIYNIKNQKNYEFSDNEIASHIQALRDEAKQLKQEAKEVLKKAKDEVNELLML